MCTYGGRYESGRFGFAHKKNRRETQLGIWNPSRMCTDRILPLLPVCVVTICRNRSTQSYQTRIKLLFKTQILSSTTLILWICLPLRHQIVLYTLRNARHKCRINGPAVYLGLELGGRIEKWVQRKKTAQIIAGASTGCTKIQWYH